MIKFVNISNGISCMLAAYGNLLFYKCLKIKTIGMKKLILFTTLFVTVSVSFAQSPMGGNTTTTKLDSSVILKAKQAPWFVERFKLSAGFLSANNNTSIKVSNSGGLGTAIDFEKDLRFNTNVGTFLSNFQWRSSRRSRFDFSYYQLNRSSTAKISKDIVFEGNTYNANATINSVFNNAIYRFSYGYAILAKPTAELGLSIGTHTLQTSVGIAATAGGTTLAPSDNFDFTAPIPDLGIWGGFSMGPKWAVNGEISYFTITTGDVKGSVIGYNAALLYTPVKNLSLALGYTGFNFNVDVKTTKESGSIDWGHNGFSFGASFSFGRKSWVH